MIGVYWGRLGKFVRGFNSFSIFCGSVLGGGYVPARFICYGLRRVR